MEFNQAVLCRIISDGLVFNSSGSNNFGFSTSFFNNLADTQVSITELLQWKVLATLAVSTLVLAVMAGSYPALLISSFSPLSLFGRKENHLVSAQGIRKGLVVLQFSASIVLIICTLVFTISFILCKTKTSVMR